MYGFSAKILFQMHVNQPFSNKGYPKQTNAWCSCADYLCYCFKGIRWLCTSAVILAWLCWGKREERVNQKINLIALL